MGPHAVDLPDPFDALGETPGDTLPADSDGDELISRLAGDEIDRLLGGAPRRAGPVQELASDLDTFFDELRQRQAETAKAVREQDQGALVIDEAERQALVGDLDFEESFPLTSPPRGFIDPVAPPAWYARPLDWCKSMVGTLSPGARLAVSLTAIVSFLAACAALTYVLILRQA